jgi:transketolase
LAVLGDFVQELLSLDAEVKNSTFAEIFEEKFPHRFLQCFVAEQNMIGMAIGLTLRGYISFSSTFASFLTRAHDQIRMAAIGQVPLRIAGSHSGVSIGQDGPSQMGLEDICQMRALPQSVVLYSSDAVSTYKLVNAMVNYNEGISYIRLTRGETPIIYDNNEDFPIGGCKVLKESFSDKACVIAAGITVHEALKAYEELKKEGINITVIDLYSIKPLDNASIVKYALAAQKKVITVEDHYIQGGLSETVCYALRNEGIKIESLAIRILPRSGKPEELLAMYQIDASSIIKAVKNII